MRKCMNKIRENVPSQRGSKARFRGSGRLRSRTVTSIDGATRELSRPSMRPFLRSLRKQIAPPTRRPPETYVLLLMLRLCRFERRACRVETAAVCNSLHWLQQQRRRGHHDASSTDPTLVRTCPHVLVVKRRGMCVCVCGKTGGKARIIRKKKKQRSPSNPFRSCGVRGSRDQPDPAWRNRDLAKLARHFEEYKKITSWTRPRW